MTPAFLAMQNTVLLPTVKRCCVSLSPPRSPASFEELKSAIARL
jgi:hypothetical protein